MTRPGLKIAVGIDFSDESDAAALQALGIARHLDAELVLVNVREVVELPPIDEGVALAREATNHHRDQEAAALAGARDRLAALRERLSGQGVVVSQLLVEDDPDHGLCAAAHELGAGLTVVGTRGRTGLRWLLLGSVAQRVARRSETDVLVARGAGQAGYRRILVATDLSAVAERALDHALALAADGAEIDVVHHADVALADGGPGASGSIEAAEWRAVQADLRAQGEQLIARKRRPGVVLTFHVSSGRPAQGIIAWLETHGHDLAVLGSHGRRGVQRGLLGSVAESVVRHAPCSVLVAHGMPEPRQEPSGPTP